MPSSVAKIIEDIGGVERLRKIYRVCEESGGVEKLCKVYQC